jgi:formamidopyrimidine-DNA glycosylase
VEPPPEEAAERAVTGVRRLGKRVVIALEGDLFLVIHLMIAGRLRWLEPGAKVPRRLGLSAFDFVDGTLLLTEAGTKKRATLHVVAGAEALAGFDRGGVEPLEADLAAYTDALRRENHTLKRSLTDPRLFSGIGNAYSDEILHRARLSPLQRSGNLSDEEIARLRDATRGTLALWTDRLREEAGDGFPVGVTAFRAGMAVHGRYREACPDCGSEVQRIRYAENEANYCPACQTGGKLLADRGLSRLLREDWPRNLDELDRLRARARGEGTGDGSTDES